jgi:LmbE family N-acetylglucosaminyl deacetylase
MRGAPANPITCISPHLDDAVLSCGQVLSRCPGARVVTVFAGSPVPEPALTPWDRLCGFASTAEAMASRRKEDRCAAGALGAEPVHLPYLDAQYRDGPPPADMAESLAACLGTGPVLVPLGLFHDDHKVVHAIVADLLADLDCAFAFYEDCPYRAIDGGRLRDEAVARLRRRWPLRVRAVHFPAAMARKAVAVGAYRSQLEPVRTTSADAMADIERAERYWTLEDHDWL